MELEIAWIEEHLSQKISSIQLFSHGLAPIWTGSCAGRKIVIKGLETYEQALCEFDGLAALEGAGFPTPGNRYVIRGTELHYLLMDWIESGRASPRQIASALIQGYGQKSEQWGYNRSNHIGILPQDNRLEEDFETFFRECRFKPQFQLGARNGLFTARDEEMANQALRRVAKDMRASRPVLIHGDLWSGNLLVSTQRIYLIDPAVAFGCPEQDLAMLLLFGGPLSVSDLQNIADETGSPPGFRERIPFWQIYPLLVHVNLFGKSYLGQLRAALAAAN